MSRGNKLDQKKVERTAAMNTHQNFMVEITAMSLDHQLFAYCCHGYESKDVIVIASKYNVESKRLLEMLERDDNNEKMISDLLNGSRGVKDVFR